MDGISFDPSDGKRPAITDLHIIQFPDILLPSPVPEETPSVARLYIASSGLWRIVLRALSNQDTVAESSIKKLESAYSYYALWADGYDIRSGKFEQDIHKSQRAGDQSIRLLQSICKTLSQSPFDTIWSKVENSADSMVSLGLAPTVNIGDNVADVAPKAAKVSLAAERLTALIQCDYEGDDSSDDDDVSTEMPRGSEDLEQIADDLHVDTQCLMELGDRFQDKVKNPIVRAAMTKYADYNAWTPSDHFTKRILLQYPKCDAALAERLGEASWLRLSRLKSLKPLDGALVSDTHDESQASDGLYLCEACGENVQITYMMQCRRSAKSHLLEHMEEVALKVFQFKELRRFDNTAALHKLHEFYRQIHQLFPEDKSGHLEETPVAISADMPPILKLPDDILDTATAIPRLPDATPPDKSPTRRNASKLKDPTSRPDDKPKLKGGCNMCKQRRILCDEKCPGYPPPSQSISQNIFKSHPPRRQSSQPKPLLLDSLSFDIDELTDPQTGQELQKGSNPSASMSSGFQYANKFPKHPHGTRAGSPPAKTQIIQEILDHESEASEYPTEIPAPLMDEPTKEQTDNLGIDENFQRIRQTAPSGEGPKRTEEEILTHAQMVEGSTDRKIDNLALPDLTPW
ncbi:hypothetical protein PG989_011865 [Apiospora arundinis]